MRRADFDNGGIRWAGVRGGGGRDFPVDGMWKVVGHKVVGAISSEFYLIKLPNLSSKCGPNFLSLDSLVCVPLLYVALI